MSDNNNLWGTNCSIWSQYCIEWSECIAEVVEIVEGGARNPAEWGDHPFDNYEDQQKALLDFQIKNPVKRGKLVDILLKCKNKKFNKTIEIPDKNIFVKII